MALSFGTSGHIPVTVSTSTTANPATGTFTCGADVEELVLCIFYAANTQRTGGSPTYGTGTFTQRESLAGVTEAVCEIWHMDKPPTGVETLVSIPNANTRTLWANVISIDAPAGYTAQYHVSGIRETTSANPYVAVTPTVTGTFAIACVATGDNTFDPTAQSGVEIYAEDHPTYGSASQYYSIGPSGTVNISWTEATSDDYGALAIVFREIVDTSPQTINLDPAILSIQGQPITLDAPAPPTTINLQPAQLSFGAKNVTVDAPPPATQVNLDPAQLSLSGKSVSIEKGAVSVPLDPAQLSLSGEPTTVQKGGVSIPLDPAQLSLSGKPVQITAPAPGIQVNLQPALLSLSAEQASLQKGAVTVTLDPALLTLSGKNVTISAPAPGIQIDLDPAQLSFSAKPSTIQKGAVTVSLDPALLSLSGKQATPSSGGTPVTINLQPARLTLSGKSASIQKGAVSIALDPALLTFSAKSTSIITPYSQTINLDPALLYLTGNPIQINPVPPTPPSPAPCIPGGGGLLRVKQRNIVVILPEDKLKKLQTDEEEILILT